jgi:hypothetical protein
MKDFGKWFREQGVKEVMDELERIANLQPPYDDEDKGMFNQAYDDLMNVPKAAARVTYATWVAAGRNPTLPGWMSWNGAGKLQACCSGCLDFHPWSGAWIPDIGTTWFCSNCACP